jgi:hypothetical protein
LDPSLAARAAGSRPAGPGSRESFVTNDARGRPAYVQLPEQDPEDDDVHRPDRESGEQELPAAELRGARGHQAGDEKPERQQVSKHEEAEKSESGAARLHKARPAERQKEVDRQQQ